MHSLFSIVTCTVLLRVATLKYTSSPSELIRLQFSCENQYHLNSFYQSDRQILTEFFGIMANSVVNRLFPIFMHQLKYAELPRVVTKMQMNKSLWLHKHNFYTVTFRMCCRLCGFCSSRYAML